MVDSSHQSSIRDRNTPRQCEQTPRISTTDWCWYTDKHLLTCLYQYSTCHLQNPEESPFLTQHTDDEGGSQVCGHCGHASSPFGCACHNTTTGSNRGAFRHTKPDQGTDETTYWGSKPKQNHSLFQMLILLNSTFLCWKNMTTQWAEYPWEHTAEPPWQHIVTQIFQMMYFHFATGRQLNKHHVGIHFYMRRNIHRGAYEDTSIKHLSSIEAQMQTVYILS